jgi:hypothetical protein
MKPELTDAVIVVGPHSTSTHRREHPGIVTQAFEAPDVASPARVNLHVFLDGMPSVPMQSVAFYPSLSEANAANPKLPFCYAKPPRT